MLISFSNITFELYINFEYCRKKKKSFLSHREEGGLALGGKVMKSCATTVNKFMLDYAQKFQVQFQNINSNQVQQCNANINHINF